jgi:Mrp family chromosome partitioning ATPase
MADRYRRLVAALHAARAQRGVNSLVVTSAAAGEGKTRTVVELALTLTDSESPHVLLIDAHRGRPGVHAVLGLRNEAGLSEWLRLERHDVPLVTLSPRLAVLTAGQAGPDATDEVDSDRMRLLLDECAARFDWILIDAPPTDGPPDARVLTRLTKAAVFVIHAGSTPFPSVERAIGEIGREWVVGTVLTGVGDELTGELARPSPE